MAGTKKGGLIAAKTNKKRHGKDFYQRVGAKGGKSGGTGGFTGDKARAKLLGALGGMNRQTKVLQGEKLQDYLQRKQVILNKIAAIDRQRNEEQTA